MARTIGLHISMPDGKIIDRDFDGDTVLIGSGPSAVLRIEDSEVSSIHAVIKKTPEGAVTIVDLGSEAGTTVNGKAVTESVTLKDGDKLSLGRVSITVALKEGAPAVSAVAPASATDKTIENDTSALMPTPKAEPKVSTPAPAKVSTPAPAKVSTPAPAPAAQAAAAPAPEKAAPKPEKSAAKAAADADDKVHQNDWTHENFMHMGDHHDANKAFKAMGEDLDPRVLSAALPEGNRPSADQHALEISISWGDTVVSECQVREPRDVVVGGRGQLLKVDLCAEVDLPVESFTIAHNRGTEAAIIVPAGAKVGVRKADGTIVRDVQLQGTDAPFPAKSYSLGFGERLVFKHGMLTFVAQYVRGEAQMGRKAGMDWYFPRIFAISALLHVFFVVAAFVTPRISTSLTDELFKNQNRFAAMILKAPEKEKEHKKLDLSGSKGGAKHKGDEGKFGKKDKPKKDALASKAGAPRVDPNKREKDRQIALNSGLLGILKGGAGPGAVSNVLGPGGLGTGINNAMGGLRGTEMGDAGGAGGLGTRGAGAGGGGNSLGIGGLGTGHGRGTGGYGNIDLGGRGKGETRIVPGKTIVEGGLSKEEIGRVIRRNLARFKYCYEKQLNANPNLQGKIAIYFQIAPTGAVADASIRETSMNDENVESCALKVMRTLNFPQPRGGGVVVVTYPFVFQPS